MQKAYWEKNFVVYHLRNKSFRKAFDLESSAKKSVTMVNQNIPSQPYAYTTWQDYWTNVAVKI